MPTTTYSYNEAVPQSGLLIADTNFTTPGNGSWAKMVSTQVLAQVDGTATSFTAVLERTSLDPAVNTVTAAPVDSTTFSGSLVTGVPPVFSVEPGVGWWRIRITSISGGNANVSISGGTS